MTWGNNGNFSRIDRIYLTNSLSEYARYTNVLETTKSDHKAIFAKLEFFKSCKNHKNIYNPWKLNDSILENNEVINGLKIKFSEIPLFKKKYEKLWYDFFIKDVIIFLKKKSREIYEKANAQKLELFSQIESLIIQILNVK